MYENPGGHSPLPPSADAHESKSSLIWHWIFNWRPKQIFIVDDEKMLMQSTAGLVLKLYFLFSAIQTRVVEQASDGKWTQLTLEVLRDFKKTDFSRKQLIDVQFRTLACFCPRLKKNRKYLLLGNYDDRKLTIDKNSIALRWRSKYKKKMLSLMEKAEDDIRC